MQALATVESAGKHYETASRLVTDIGKGEAFHLDRVNLARLYVIAPKNDVLARYRVSTQMFEQQLTNAKDEAQGNESLLAAIDKFHVAARQWRLDVGDPIVKLAGDSDMQQRARDLVASQHTSETEGAIRVAVTNVQNEVSVWLKEVSRQRDEAVRNARYLQAAGAGLTIVLLVLIGWWLSRQIAKPVSQMTAAMRNLAAGDHNIVIPAVGRRDEVGQMATAVQSFKDAAIEKIRLETEAETARQRAEEERAARAAEKAEEERQSQIAISALGEGLERLSSGDLTFRIEVPFEGRASKLREDFNAAVERLQQTLLSVVASVNAIHAGTGEISTAADDLSRRTEQQAASLEETAAALDQITATVKKTAEGAS
ncbi:chemotaxis protein, partial [Mesorhizobium soli]